MFCLPWKIYVYSAHNTSYRGVPNTVTAPGPGAAKRKQNVETKPKQNVESKPKQKDERVKRKNRIMIVECTKGKQSPPPQMR